VTAATMAQEGQRPPSSTPARIWRLQFGPCWCGSVPPDSGSFDYVRMRQSDADLGSIEDNLLIVSDRVIDGSAKTYRAIHAEVPDPKLVVAVGTCPKAERFWDGLPNGWTAVDDVLSVDIRVEECISGYPEALMAAMVGHFLARQERGAVASDTVGLNA